MMIERGPFPVQNLRACQVEGITNLGESFAAALVKRGS